MKHCHTSKEKHWDVVNACTCQNACYGYHKCTCNQTCDSHGVGDCSSCHQASYTAAGCTCDEMCYGEAAPGDWECTAPDLDTDDKRDTPNYIMGRIYLPVGGVATPFDSEPAALPDDWADLEFPFDNNPATSAEWIPSEVSGVSAIGYVATGGLAGGVHGAANETSTFALSSNISHMYMTVGWDSPRPIAGIHLYKNSGLIHSSYRPVRRTGYRAHWSDDVAEGNAGITWSSSGTDAAHPVASLHDGLSTTWHSNSLVTNSVSAVIKIDLGAAGASAICRYDLQKRNSTTRYYDPYSWKFYGSADNAAWTLLDTRATQHFGTQLSWLKCDFANTTAYRYYKLVISAVHGGSAYDAILMEMRLYTWIAAVGSVTNQTTQSVSMHYLSAGDKIRVVPSVSLVDDYIIADCPSGNYISVAKLTGQGGLL